MGKVSKTLTKSPLLVSTLATTLAEGQPFAWPAGEARLVTVGMI